MLCPCDCCPAWDWEPRRDGGFFCVGARGFGEPLIQYRNGGYHPVHVGDTLRERYTIVNKLGWGRDGIVWLAKDGRYSRLVAIKICRSEIRSESEEETSLGRLTTGSAKHPGKKHVVLFLDRFEIKGPNGRHLCLVVEAFGPTVDPDPLSPHAAWAVTKQMMEGVSYIHDLGIVHGDLRLEKFLFSDSRYLHSGGDSTKPPKKAKVYNIQPVDAVGNVLPIYGSSVTARVPQYLVKSCPALLESDSTLTVNDYHVKLTGFGKSRPVIGEVHGGFEGYEFGYQAPEVLLDPDSQLGSSADIWSLARLMYEVLGGAKLHHHHPKTKDDTDEIIDDWIAAFGNLPEEWASHCPPRPSHLLCQPGEENMLDGLQRHLFALLPGTLWFSKDDLDIQNDLLTSMTRYRPSDRPSAAELLQHPWFQHRPSLTPVAGPSREEAEAAFVLDKTEYLKRWNIKDESSIGW